MKRRGKDADTINGAAKIFDEYKKCDGFVTDVSTALTALALGSLFFAFTLILFERIKLLHYRTAEEKYESS